MKKKRAILRRWRKGYDDASSRLLRSPRCRVRVRSGSDWSERGFSRLLKKSALKDVIPAATI
jgi:hypothetical protein